MKYKLDTLKNALFLKSGINILKYLEIILITPLLIKSLGSGFADYLFIISTFNVIFFLDFNLQNYGVNLLYNREGSKFKLIFYSSYLKLFFPLVLITITLLLLLNFKTINLAWYLLGLQVVFIFLSAQWGSFISSSKGFFFTNLISVSYNLINILLILCLTPGSILGLSILKLSSGFLLFLSTIIFLKLNFKDFSFIPKFKFNLKSYIKIWKLALVTKEYSFQKAIEFINVNFLALLIIPFDKMLGTQLIIIKSVLSISVFATNFFVSIYQQMFLNKGNSKLILKIFKFNNISFIILTFIIIGFFKFEFLNLIKHFFNFGVSILSIKSELIYLLVFYVLFINLNKQQNIKRNTRLLSMKLLSIPTIIYISIFFLFSIFKSLNTTLILSVFLFCEILYFIILKKGLNEDV
jgi:hypothetical protein